MWPVWIGVGAFCIAMGVKKAREEFRNSSTPSLPAPNGGGYLGGPPSEQDLYEISAYDPDNQDD